MKIRQIKPQMPKPRKSHMALVLVLAYAVAITPLAYQEARRQVILWASVQPDMPMGGGYTVADRNELLNAAKAVPALTAKERGK